MNIIRQTQPKRAQGAAPVKPFQHKAKHRASGISQEIKASPWEQMMATSTRVDADRVNWKGIIYLQQAAGVYNPNPRLVKHGREA